VLLLRPRLLLIALGLLSLLRSHGLGEAVVLRVLLVVDVVSVRLQLRGQLLEDLGLDRVNRGLIRGITVPNGD
jgi:hypothetical protein